MTMSKPNGTMTTATVREDPQILSDKHQSRPKDHYYLVAICCFVLGVGVLLPWNAFITVQNYWNYKFRDPLDPISVTPLQLNLNSYITIAFNVPYVLCMTLATYYSHKLRHEISNSVSLCLVLLTFLSVACLVPINSDSWQNLFLIITLAQVVGISLGNGIVQTGITGLISMLPPSYIGQFLEGQALAGVFTSLINVLILICKISPVSSALIYFICALIGLTLAVTCYAVLHNSSFFKSYYHKKEDKPCPMEMSIEKEESAPVSTFEVIKSTWRYCLSMMVILWMTLSVFPAICSQVQSIGASNESLISTTLFVPLTCFLLFNVGDYIGRLLPKWLPFPENKPNLLLGLCISRAIFLPLFMLCNLRVHNVLPAVFTHDAFYGVFMLIFAVSNGYLMSSVFMRGPKSLEDPKKQQKAGSLLVTCLCLGLNLGALTSLILVRLV